MLIDTHCHIADVKFEPDRGAVLARARDAGVTTLIEIAESPHMWEAAVALAENYPFIYASLGIHPHHAHQAGPEAWPGLQTRLRELLKHPKVMAIGEFGLDYFRMQNTQEQQDYLFRQQLDLAKELNKPIVIHCRDAHADLQKVLLDVIPAKAGIHNVNDGFRLTLPPVRTRRRAILPRKQGRMATAGMTLREAPNGVIHCFSGTWEDAQTYLAHGFMLGINAPVTYPNSKQLQENVTRLPLERMVLETDSPYLPPQTHRGQRNEPAYLTQVAEAVGGLKHKTSQDVADQTSDNARVLFRLV